MRIVSQKSKAEIDQARALAEVGDRLRALSANLLRVIRGAGKPYEIERQVYELANAFTAHRQATGSGVQNDILAAELHPELLRARFRPWILDDKGQLPLKDDVSGAWDTIVRGALQVTASQLLDQLAQESRGENEMLDGLLALRRAQGSP